MSTPLSIDRSEPWKFQSEEASPFARVPVGYLNDNNVDNVQASRSNPSLAAQCIKVTLLRAADKLLKY